MKKESTGGGCSAGEEIDTSQQQRDAREFHIIAEERKKKGEWAIAVALLAQRASRDKSVYGEVTGMVHRLGRGGYHRDSIYEGQG